MSNSSIAARSDTLLRLLCIIVLAIVVGAVGFAAWIAISNFSRIGV